MIKPEDLPVSELLAMVAEEAGELAHAALKLRRSIDQTNPTPLTSDDCENEFIMELADLLLCLRVAGYDLETDSNTRREALGLGVAKYKRWIRRLNEGLK